MKKDYTVRQITRADCERFILHIHYAKRWPSISYAYGLFHCEDLVGCITYGSPASPPARTGLAGPEMAKHVLELNRLCLGANLKNEASFLISKSLKLLPPERIILSFADKSKGHTGTFYQAANFLYLGLSAKRTDWAIKGKEHLHGITIADEFRGVPNRAAAVREKYGDDFYLKPRPRKHRYIYLVGSKKWKRDTKKLIRYKEEKYPKTNKMKKTLTEEQLESLENVFQTTLSLAIEKMGLNRSCLSCANFDEGKELCDLANKRPPARTIVEGCDSFTTNEPF